ncbi:hypothetical protein HOH51_01935, partial [bacterium]|nr:hypothetical protein [bacterium]
LLTKNNIFNNSFKSIFLNSANKLTQPHTHASLKSLDFNDTSFIRFFFYAINQDVQLSRVFDSQSMTPASKIGILASCFTLSKKSPTLLEKFMPLIIKNERSAFKLQSLNKAISILPNAIITIFEALSETNPKLAYKVFYKLINSNLIWNEDLKSVLETLSQEFQNLDAQNVHQNLKNNLGHLLAIISRNSQLTDTQIQSVTQTISGVKILVTKATAPNINDVQRSTRMAHLQKQVSKSVLNFLDTLVDTYYSTNLKKALDTDSISVPQQFDSNPRVNLNLNNFARYLALPSVRSENISAFKQVARKYFTTDFSGHFKLPQDELAETDLESFERKNFDYKHQVMSKHAKFPQLNLDPWLSKNEATHVVSAVTKQQLTQKYVAVMKMKILEFFEINPTLKQNTAKLKGLDLNTLHNQFMSFENNEGARDFAEYKNYVDQQIAKMRNARETKVPNGGQEITISIEQDPMEVLQMGNYSEPSCLAINGEFAPYLIANITDINKNVVYIKIQDKVVARVLIALNDKRELVRYRIYNHRLDLDIEPVVLTYLDGLAKQMNTQRGYSGKVEVLVPATQVYDDGIISRQSTTDQDLFYNQ